MYGKLISESENESKLIKGFKTKNRKFIFYELNDPKVLKLPCVKENEKIYKDLKYKIDKGLFGEIAIDKITGKFAGYIICHKYPEGVWIGPLFIEEEFKGYGLSNQLMKDGVEKYNVQWLGVYTDNEVAIDLYKKFGLKMVQKYTECKEKYNKEDAI